MRPSDSPDNIMSARFATDDEIALIKRAATRLGLNPSAFMRLACLEQARKVIEEDRKLEEKGKPRGKAKLVSIKGGKR